MFLNRVILIGRIGKITTRTIERDGEEVPVVDINLAVNRSYKDEDGGRPTDWIRVQVWNGLAEAVQKFGKVGRLVAVEGELRTSQYNREVTAELDGKEIIVEVPTIGTSIMANAIRFLDSAGTNSSDEAEGSKPGSAKGQARVVRGSRRSNKTGKESSPKDRPARKKAVGDDDVPF